MAIPKAKAKKIGGIIFFMILAIWVILTLIFDPESLGIYKTYQTIEMYFDDNVYTIEVPSTWEQTESDDMPNATVYSSKRSMIACEFTSYGDSLKTYDDILKEYEQSFNLMNDLADTSYIDDEFSCSVGKGHLYCFEIDNIVYQKFVIDGGEGMLGAVYSVDVSDLTDSEKQSFIDLGEDIIKSIDKK